MKFITLLVLIGFSFQLNAQASKEEISSMIDQMVANQVFTKEAGEVAKNKLNNMSDSDLNKLNERGNVIAEKIPSRGVASSTENQKINFDGDQFKAIQSEVQKATDSK
jgi:spore germination protein GerM